MLDDGDYPAALELCRISGFDKNDFYVYTNTGGFRPDVPFRYLIVPTSDVLGLLSPVDPRKISRSDVLERVRSVERLG